MVQEQVCWCAKFYVLSGFSHPILFINFAYTFVSTSIQRIIFPSRHTANTRLFWLILLNHYMSPSKVLPHPAESPGPFSRPCKKLHSQQARFTDQGKCYPMQSQTSPRHLPDASPTAVRPLRFTQLPLGHGKMSVAVRACAWNERGSACNAHGSCACAWNMRVSLFIIIKYMVVLG